MSSATPAMAQDKPMAPKISVLLSSYNHEAFVQEAIDSVLQQSFGDFELIILDDASSDRSWDVISRNDDPRIRAYRNASRIGAVNSANWAIEELVRGEFVAIHHSDDAWTPTKLERQLAAFEADPALGAVFTWVQVIDECGTQLENDWFNRPSAKRWTLLAELFQEENHLAHPSALIRRECYASSGLYNPLLVQTPDADMWCRLLLAWPIEIIPEKLTHHRLLSNRSNTSSTARADVRVRTANEWNHLRRHFLQITEAQDFFCIFPALEQKLALSAPCPMKFLLAMACLHVSDTRNAWQLGIQCLQEAMNDETERKAIERACGFSIADLSEITGSRDPYGVLDKEGFAKEFAALEKTAIEAHQDATRSWQELERERARGAALALEHEQLTQRHGALELEHGKLSHEHDDLKVTAAAVEQGLEQELERMRAHPVWKMYTCIRNVLKKLHLIKND